MYSQKTSKKQAKAYKIVNNNHKNLSPITDTFSCHFTRMNVTCQEFTSVI